MRRRFSLQPGAEQAASNFSPARKRLWESLESRGPVVSMRYVDCVTSRLLAADKACLIFVRGLRSISNILRQLSWIGLRQ